jgi:hypothetical protein
MKLTRTLVYQQQRMELRRCGLWLLLEMSSLFVSLGRRTESNSNKKTGHQKRMINTIKK